MFVFPLIATLVSFVFSGLLLHQYINKKKPYQLAWAVAMSMFGLASLAETLASSSGWTELLVKIWYLFGGMLVVGYLALGSLYVTDNKTATNLLLIGVILTLFGPVLPMIIFSKTSGQPEKIRIALLFVFIAFLIVSASRALKRPATVWLVFVLFASLAGVYMLNKAPVDLGLLPTEGWQAIERSFLMKVTVASINTLGSIILIGGALYSGWALMRKGIMRERAKGSILIAIGALINVAGGFVHGYFKMAGQTILSISLALGVIIMFLGFLETGRQPTTPGPTRNEGEKENA